MMKRLILTICQGQHALPLPSMEETWTAIPYSADALEPPHTHETTVDL